DRQSGRHPDHRRDGGSAGDQRPHRRGAPGEARPLSTDAVRPRARRGRGAGKLITSNHTARTVVIGGSGYIAGELLRLLAVHPFLRDLAVISESKPGTRVEDSFPHLEGAYPDLKFLGVDALPRLFAENETVAVFSAAPHGASAPLVDSLLENAEHAGARVRLVDLSADFRFPNAASYEQVYGHPHGAPGGSRSSSPP